MSQDIFELAKGRGRTRVRLAARGLGGDLVVFIHNENAHIGAVSLGEWDEEHKRASVSVITRLGHKDDAIASRAAYQICKSLRRPVCVIAGIHLDEITMEEIKRIEKNAGLVVADFLKME
jgi:hypothetical protein